MHALYLAPLWTQSCVIWDVRAVSNYSNHKTPTFFWNESFLVKARVSSANISVCSLDSLLHHGRCDPWQPSEWLQSSYSHRLHWTQDQKYAFAHSFILHTLHNLLAGRLSEQTFFLFPYDSDLQDICGFSCEDLASMFQELKGLGVVVQQLSNRLHQVVSIRNSCSMQ